MFQGDSQDVVVAVVPLELWWQCRQSFTAAEHHLQGSTLLIKRNTISKIALGAEIVKQPRDQSRITAFFSRIPLEAINLFDNLDRDDHVVVLESIQSLGIMQQDIGVQNKSFAHLPTRTRLAGR